MRLLGLPVSLPTFSFRPVGTAVWLEGSSAAAVKVGEGGLGGWASSGGGVGALEGKSPEERTGYPAEWDRRISSWLQFHAIMQIYNQMHIISMFITVDRTIIDQYLNLTGSLLSNIGRRDEKRLAMLNDI